MSSILKVLTEKNRRNIQQYFEIFRPKKLLKDDGRWPPEHLNLTRSGYSIDEKKLKISELKLPWMTPEFSVLASAISTQGAPPLTSGDGSNLSGS